MCRGSAWTRHALARAVGQPVKGEGLRGNGDAPLVFLKLLPLVLHAARDLLHHLGGRLFVNKQCREGERLCLVRVVFGAEATSFAQLMNDVSDACTFHAVRCSPRIEHLPKDHLGAEFGAHDRQQTAQGSLWLWEEAGKQDGNSLHFKVCAGAYSHRCIAAAARCSSDTPKTHPLPHGISVASRCVCLLGHRCGVGGAAC
mmetsp:Transcript_8196/g.20003  ORF Transcript_8196/g.20003 Transcript_8196/m.20003 type:complete len:200 (+) Transcript_8196:306-905(+)